MAILAGVTPSDSDKMRHSALASENMTNILSAITWKRCKIGSMLVLITNRKSYMRFRFVTKSVTLNGVMAVTLRYFTEFGKPALHKMIMAEFMQEYCIFSACTMSS